ncbi:ABC transporter permease subunit [Candidatus Riflebacteria bacterium]
MLERLFSPIFVKRVRKFQSMKRGYYAFIILVFLYILSFFNFLVVNDQALFVRFQGTKHYPALNEQIRWLFNFLPTKKHATKDLKRFNRKIRWRHRLPQNTYGRIKAKLKRLLIVVYFKTRATYYYLKYLVAYPVEYFRGWFVKPRLTKKELGIKGFGSFINYRQLQLDYTYLFFHENLFKPGKNQLDLRKSIVSNNLIPFKNLANAKDDGDLIEKLNVLIKKAEFWEENRAFFTEEWFIKKRKEVGELRDMNLAIQKIKDRFETEKKREKIQKTLSELNWFFELQLHGADLAKPGELSKDELTQKQKDLDERKDELRAALVDLGLSFPAKMFKRKLLREEEKITPGLKSLKQVSESLKIEANKRLLLLQETRRQHKKYFEFNRLLLQLCFPRILRDFQDNPHRVMMPFYPYHPNVSLLDMPGTPPHSPTNEHWFGTDDRARDVLARLIYGFNISISFALVVVIISYCIGIWLGACLGYYGGKFDIMMQRVVEIWQAIPFLYAIMIIASIIKPSFFMLAFLLVFWGWIAITYYIRGEFYREKTKEYVLAAEAIGVSDAKIMFVHILPNALTPIISFAPFAIVAQIRSLVMLDFLGFGLPVPTPSWGELLGQGLANLTSPWLAFAPLGALFFTLLLISFIGEAVREAFDPKPFSRLR